MYWVAWVAKKPFWGWPKGAYCIFDYICVMPILIPWDMSTLSVLGIYIYIYIHIYIYIYHINRVTYLVPTGRYSLVTTLRKIKYKVKWKVKIVKTWNYPPSSQGSPFSLQLSSWKRIRLHMDFTLFVNSLKKFFEPTKI